MDSILEKVNKNLNKIHIKNKSLLLGFSGGKDSSALLYLLLKTSKIYNLKIALIYINHNLRTDSMLEEKFIIKTAKKYNLKLYKIRINKNYWMRLKKSSIEMAARKVRYNFFNKILVKNKFDYILTAHNFNDKIETYFINMFRASGINTLKSIQLKNKKIIRPLINVTREEIDEYLNENNLIYYEDYTNTENIYKRNIIRNKLLPVFKELHSNYQKSFAHIFNFLEEENNFLYKLSVKKIKKIIFYKTDDLYCIKYDEYKKTNIVIQKIILKIILSKLKLLHILNKKLINNLTGNKEKYLYNKENLICTGCKNYIWFINKSLNQFDKFNIYIKKIPDDIKIGNNIIKIKYTSTTNYMDFFTFNLTNEILPLNLKSLTPEDSINWYNEKNKLIHKILKELKIPKILYNRVIVIKSKQNKIIGFIFYKIFKVSKDFFVYQNSNNKIIITIV